MAHLSPKYFRLYQEGFERSFAYGKAFIHQDQFCSPERGSGIFSTPKTPKSILKASRKSGFKSKRRILINEALNETRRFSLRSESSDEISDDRDTAFQTPEKEQQNQRFHTAPDASIDYDSDFSFGCVSEDTIKQPQLESKSNSNLYTKVNNLFSQSTNYEEEGDLNQKSGLSETEKDYIRKLQKSREQQIYQEMVGSRSEFNRTPEKSPNNVAMTNSQLSSSQNSFFEANSRELSRKNSSTGFEAGKSRNAEASLSRYSDKLKASAMKRKEFVMKAREEKVPIRSRNYEKENTIAKGLQTSPKSQKVISSVQLKEKYESLEERIEQLKQENRELRDKLEMKRKAELETTVNKTPIKQNTKDIKPQNSTLNTMNRTADRFIPKKSDQMNYVTRILANSKDREIKAKEATEKKIQKIPSASNLRDPRGPRPSFGMNIPQGMSSSCMGFYKSSGTDQTFKSGRNI